MQYATMTNYILHALASAEARHKIYVRLVLTTIEYFRRIRKVVSRMGKKRAYPGPCQNAECSLWPLAQLYANKTTFEFHQITGMYSQ